MKTSMLAVCALMSLALPTGHAAADASLETARDGVAYLLDSETIADSPSLRVMELAERITPGIRRWNATLVGAEFMVAIKVNAGRETEELVRFDERTSFYVPEFAEKLPAPRDFPDTTPFVEKARALVQADRPDATVEPGHILVYKICQPEKEGEISKYATGCKRDKPFREWRIFLKITPQSGDWFVAKVLFADDEPGTLSAGPRGYFE